jgi:hypothetical protein
MVKQSMRSADNPSRIGADDASHRFAEERFEESGQILEEPMFDALWRFRDAEGGGGLSQILFSGVWVAAKPKTKVCAREVAVNMHFCLITEPLQTNRSENSTNLACTVAATVPIIAVGKLLLQPSIRDTIDNG